MHYNEWGFNGNPFATSSLPATEEGSRLMVGRDDLIQRIQKRTAAGSKIVTVEGLNGVGKTSLINVALFRHFKARLLSDRGPLLIPCRSSFQLDAHEAPAQFRRRVLLEVLQTLIDRRANLPVPRGMVKAPRDSSIETWLNSPVLREISGGISILGSGANVGHALTINGSVGFEESGLEKRITDWLQVTFPDKPAGGIVCTIDNLELLQTSKHARESIEALRDTLLTIPGIRWILCGALGIINGVVTSPRLAGYLHQPLEVFDLDNELAERIFETRIAAMRARSDARLPINAEQFARLFDLYRGNLRSALAGSDEFCTYIAEEFDSFTLFDEDLFDDWAKDQVFRAFEAVKSELRPAAFKVFELACQMSVFSPSDCEAFGYKTPMALRPQIKALEEVGVLVSTQDDVDKRRKTIQVTPKGWKVWYHIKNIGFRSA